MVFGEYAFTVSSRRNSSTNTTGSPRPSTRRTFGVPGFASTTLTTRMAGTVGAAAGTHSHRKEGTVQITLSPGGPVTTRPGSLKLLPTPQARDGDGRGASDPAARRAGGHSVGLDDAVSVLTPSRSQVVLFPTPLASD